LTIKISNPETHWDTCIKYITQEGFQLRMKKAPENLSMQCRRRLRKLAIEALETQSHKQHLDRNLLLIRAGIRVRGPSLRCDPFPRPIPAQSDRCTFAMPFEVLHRNSHFNIEIAGSSEELNHWWNGGLLKQWRQRAISCYLRIQSDWDEEIIYGIASKGDKLYGDHIFVIQFFPTDEFKQKCQGENGYAFNAMWFQAMALNTSYFVGEEEGEIVFFITASPVRAALV